MRKFTLLILTLFLSVLTYGQSSIFQAKDLIEMAKSSYDDFETFIMPKGFDYEKTKNYSYFTVVCYKMQGKILSKYVSETNPRNILQYETNSKTEYLSLKNQIKKMGYEFITNKKSLVADEDGSFPIYQIFRKNNTEFQFCATNQNIYLGYSVIVEVK
mgnify:FL=1